jgi:hypothetical protein
LLYAGAICVAFLRISVTVASASMAPRFHLWSWSKFDDGAEPGIRSEVGAKRGLRLLACAWSGLATAPFKRVGSPNP